MAEEPKNPKDMDLGEMQQIVASQITDAVTWIDTNVAQDRKRATEYYRGDPFGDEEGGRSQAISRDVADTVNQVLPSLMRIFFGPDKVVEFAPQGPEDVEMAQQATDYVNYIFMRDNPGFEILFAAFKDALIRKAGIIKWWWDESEEIRTAEYSGLTPESLNLLLQDVQNAEKAEVIESEENDDGELEVTIRLTRKKDRVVIQALPPEEFLIDRNARDIDSATFVAHRRMMTVSELVAMGYDEDEVRSQSEEGDELRYNLDRLSRNPYAQLFGVVPNLDPASKLVLYIESYQRIDTDGDGIAEMIRVCTIGPTFKIIHWEPVEGRNFAAFVCDPEPHTFFGYSLADKTMDIQRQKSALLRMAMDGLSLSVNPRMKVNTRLGGANALADAMNTEIGAIIRVDDMNAVEPFVQPDVSPSAFEAMGYLDQVKESRTGMSRVGMGLDPKALQNTSATAAAGQFTQSQQHIELIARIFAENGMKRLMRGILKMVVENQRQARMIDLRGTFVPMDPRGWRTDMDVVANVAIGGGTNGEKIAVLNTIKETQEQIIMQYGPDNPLVGLEQYHHTLTQMLQLTGWKNADSFFKDPAQEPERQPQPPPPDPKLVEVQMKGQIEQAKLQMQAKADEAKAMQEQQKAQADIQIQRERMAAEMELQQQRMAGEMALAQQKIQMEYEQKAAELELKRQELTTEAAIKAAEVQRNADRADTETDAKLSSDVRTGGEPG